MQLISSLSCKAFARLRRCERATAVTELALVLPFFLGVGLAGLEVTNYVVVQLRVNQLAVHVADHAARIGEESQLLNRKIYESDINDLLHGAGMQAGDLDFYEHGRVILSSLEVMPETEGQNWIHWQRCLGEKPHPSSYGEEGDGRDSGIAGMGPEGEEVYAFDDEAVMFVEVAYDYQPIAGGGFIGFDTEIIARASFNVRSDRDLAQIYQRDPSNPDDVAECDQFTAEILES